MLPRRPAGAAALPEDRLFDIYRRGSRIGSHAVRFRPLGTGTFEVETVVEIAVKVLLVTAYRFRQEGQERWEDGRLVASDVATDDNGKRTRVRVREAGGEGLRVEGEHGTYAVEPGTMTDLGFWNQAVTRQSRLVDGQHGELLSIRFAPPVEDSVAVGGRTVPAVRYESAANASAEGTPRRGKTWYDREGRWVRTEFETRGELLVFQLRA